MINSSFSNCSGKNGGAIYLYKCQIKNQITNCKFSNNKALAVGGVIYTYFSELKMIDSFITNNQALIGGFIYYEGIIPQIAIQDLNNTFIDNLGKIFG